jgi:hypothetical protein
LQSQTPKLSFDVVTLRSTYQVLSDERIAGDVRKWDTVRIGSVFALGLLAAAGGLLTHNSTPSAGYFIAGAVLIVASAVLWWWVRANVRREAALQYATEFSMYQVEKLLGLHRELVDPSERWLPDQRFIFGEKHLSWRFATGNRHRQAAENDLSWWLSAKTATHGFIRMLDILFGGFFVASVGFAVVLFLLGARAS